VAPGKSPVRYSSTRTQTGHIPFPDQPRPGCFVKSYVCLTIPNTKTPMLLLLLPIHLCIKETRHIRSAKTRRALPLPLLVALPDIGYLHFYIRDILDTSITSADPSKDMTKLTNVFPSIHRISTQPYSQTTSSHQRLNTSLHNLPHHRHQPAPPNPTRHPPNRPSLSTKRLAPHSK
jgi:hypothetical protein